MSHLRLFDGLAQTGQISAAAAMLAISQPAASRLAAEAERITGARLYERTSHGIVLTPAGRAFANRAGRMLLEVAETERELSEILKGNAGTVNIGSVTGPAVEHVLPAIRQARVHLPRITVNVEVSTSDVLGEALIEGKLDFILARLPARRDPRQFEAHFIGPEPISLIVRQGHPLLRRPEHTMRRLMEFDWVLPQEGALLRSTIEAALLAQGMSLPVKMLNTSSFLLTLVTVNQTNAIAPVATSVARFFASQSGMNSAIGELALDMRLEVPPYALITITGRELTPAAKAMYSLVAGSV
ncbi:MULTISPECIES: LysR family transcriptional regulator [Rhodomicrobium]|uniref:LysR family transcriptional regulator n=1 Tax=Rhodomicrobium TaxID=1068 RepID=UPI0014829B28|nr:MULTISPECIES: LysR family transcriptional regulator [Rhodomicrobium]